MNIFIQQIYQYHLDRIGIPLIYQIKNIDDLHYEWYDQENRNGWEADWEEKGIKENTDSLLLLGNVGTGKTTLVSRMIMVLLVEEIIKHKIDISIKYLNFSHYLQKLRRSFSSLQYFEDDSGIIEKTKYLFLDDLGVEKTTEWTTSLLYRIVNYRYENQMHLCCVSNYPINELRERTDDRIISRLLEMCRVVTLEGRDRRIS